MAVVHARVRQQYKTLLFLADHHPTLAAEVARGKVRERFAANRDLQPGSVEWKRALAWGRYWEKELEALVHLHKYRAVNKRYRDDS